MSFIEPNTGLEFEVIMITDSYVIIRNELLGLDYKDDACVVFDGDSWSACAAAIKSGEGVSVEFLDNYYGILSMNITLTENGVSVGNRIKLRAYQQLQISLPAPYYDVCHPPSRVKSAIASDVECDILTLVGDIYEQRILAYLREKKLSAEVAELRAIVDKLVKQMQ